MANASRKVVSERQWLAAVDAYERGTKHASQIARDLGVSSSTVSREFKRRGCVKASRVAESIAALEKALDAVSRRRAKHRLVAEAEAMERCAELDRMIGGMMKSLIAAERAGNLAAAGPMIEKVRRSLA
jgi:IS30 family transposase